MKRNELTVGMLVAVGNLNGAQSNIRRARVLALTADRAHRSGRDQLLGGVEVEFDNGTGFARLSQVVALQKIVGPWESTRAQVTEWVAAHQARVNATEAAKRQAKTTIDSAVALLKTLGIQAQAEHVGSWDNGWWKLTLDPSQTERLVARLGTEP